MTFSGDRFVPAFSDLIIVGEAISVTVFEATVEDSCHFGVAYGSVIDVYVVDAALVFCSAVTVFTDDQVGEGVGRSSLQLLGIDLFAIFIETNPLA